MSHAQGRRATIADYDETYSQAHQFHTYDASYHRQAIEWPAPRQSSGVEFSQQVVQQEESNGQQGGDDHATDEHDHTLYEHSQRERRSSSTDQEQLFRDEPPIARFVRSAAQRTSSQGRNFFSPSGLQNCQKAVTSYGAVEFPLLPMPKPHGPISLSAAALEFAAFGSGEFWKCVKLLKEHKELLKEDYHAFIQEAWIAIWDERKHYAHQCLSRWYFLDKCHEIWPRDIEKHINRRSFNGCKFLDEVDAMYNTLKDLRKRVLHERKQAAKRDLESNGNGSSNWSFKGIQGCFQGIDAAKVFRNAGHVCRLVTTMTREFKAGNQEAKAGN